MANDLLLLGAGPGAGVAAFSPTDIAGLAGWWKADGTLWQDSARTTPATSDADPVGAWDDGSGNARHAIQATGTLRPTLKTAIQNGLAVVRIDATDDKVVSAASIVLNAQYHLFLVARSNTSGRSFATLSTGGSIKAFFSNGEATANKWDVWENNQGFHSSSGSITGSWKLLEAKFNSGTLTLYIDGMADGTFAATGGTVPSASNYQLTIGRREDSGAAALDGDFGEVLLYDSALSDTDRQNVETYLTTKWGL